MLDNSVSRQSSAFPRRGLQRSIQMLTTVSGLSRRRCSAVHAACKSALIMIAAPIPMRRQGQASPDRVATACDLGAHWPSLPRLVYATVLRGRCGLDADWTTQSTNSKPLSIPIQVLSLTESLAPRATQMLHALQWHACICSTAVDHKASPRKGTQAAISRIVHTSPITLHACRCLHCSW